MKPVYDSRPSVPAATPKSDAVRLRILDMTWCREGVSSRINEKRGGNVGVCLGPSLASWCAYLGVVLDAGSDNWIDG